MKKRETELKLAVSPEQARTLVGAKALEPYRAGRAQSRRLVSTYYDTPRHALRKRGMALRVRADGPQYWQTLKAPVPGPAGLQNFMEWTWPLDAPAPVLSHLVETGLGATAGVMHLLSGLRPVFTTEFKRTTALLETRRARIELAVDQGEIRTQARGRPAVETICEAELELVSGDPSELLRIALAICESCDARPAFATKARRGYALASPALRAEARKAPAVLLRSEMTIHEALRQIVSDSLDHLIANLEPAARSDPDGIHQLRVGLRRLRAVLHAFKTVLPQDERRRFNEELRWFQQCFAASRDWHVFLSETLPQLVADTGVSGRNLEKLRRVAREERRRATRAAIDHLKSRRYSQLLLQLQQWIGALDARHESSLDRPLVPFARRVLRSTHRAMLAETRPLSRLSTAELHELRKTGKQARYATEFFASLWPHDRVKPYLKRVEGLQTRFGHVNDAAVASRLVTTLKPGRIDPRIADLVQLWSDDRVKKSVHAARRGWLHYRKARPFWSHARAINPNRST
jgi:triphosphatase